MLKAPVTVIPRHSLPRSSIRLLLACGLLSIPVTAGAQPDPEPPSAPALAPADAPSAVVVPPTSQTAPSAPAYPPQVSYPPAPPGYAPPPPYPAYPAPAGYRPIPYDPRPRYLPYVPGEPAPPGYVFDEQVRGGPLVGGLVTLGVPYLLGLLVAAQENYNNKKSFLVVPGIGPWLTLLTRDSSCDQSLPISDCTEDSATRFVLVLDGMLQTTGAILATYGIVNTRKRYVLNGWTHQVSVTPRPRRQGVGLDVTVTF